MSVDSTNPEYNTYIDEWRKVSDCCEGQRAIKAANEKYLKPMENTTAMESRYKNYLERACFVNFTGRTKEGLKGSLFRKDPETNIPEGLDYLIENADGAGESLISLTKDLAGEVISKGRYCLLVDFPSVESGLTLEEEKALEPRACINRYNAESFINWNVSIVGGRKVLTLAVLSEPYDADGDEFGYEMETQYRVLRLRNGVYTQQLYRDGEPFGQEFSPKKSDGSTFGYIPLFIAGSENNDASVDLPPLADIANINIAHYRNSADLEENCFIHGQLTLGVTSSMSLAQFAEANPAGITVGSMAGHFLGESGGFTSVQASENQLADRLMERKEGQMRKLGARMIVIGTMENTSKTATQSKIDATGESSVLATITDNVSEAIETCIKWCGDFMGINADEAIFKLSKKFFDDDADPQLMMAAIQLNDRGIIAKSDMQDFARIQGIVKPERTNEEIDEETETNPIPLTADS
jgi:hypothetical protein